MMTSLVKKVLRGGSGKKTTNGTKKDSTVNGNHDSRRPSYPQLPPSPDLSGLSPEEVTRLKDVIKRQEEFEHQEIERLERLKESVVVYEEEVKKFASQKSKLKQVDLRLCRLCFKTKFADGIGKACAECHKRVCNKCGSFSKPKTNGKKSKGRWRCSMCQMKRDMVAMSGVWYHGNEGLPVTASMLMKKLSISEVDSSENDQSIYKFSGTDAIIDESVENKESDVFTSDSPFKPVKKVTPTKKPARLRRRSTTSLSERDSIDIEDDTYIDGQQFQKERQKCREQRHTRKCRKRLRSCGSGSQDNKDSRADGATDSDLRLSETCTSSRRERSSSDHWYSSDNDKCRSFHEPDVPYHHTRRRNDNSATSGDSDSREKRRSLRKHDTIQESPRTRTSDRRGHDRKSNIRKATAGSVYSSRDSITNVSEANQASYRTNANYRDGNNRDDKREMLLSKRSVPSSSIDEMDWNPAPVNTDAQHTRRSSKASHKRYSQDSRISRESWASRDSRLSRDSVTSRESFDQSPTVARSKLTKSKLEAVQRHDECLYSSSSSFLSDNRTSDCYDDSSCHERSDTSPSRPSHSLIGEQFSSPKPVFPRNKSIQPTLSSNCLSPDMALNWDPRRRQRKSRSQDSTVYSHRSGSVSPKYSTDHTDAGTGKDSHGRRMTLSHCENISFTEHMFGNNVLLSRPHEILIHKDKGDQSVRTNGLGMRVVGGRNGPGGTLGAYVTCVVKGGPADAQNISEGDQIIEWNGRSLVDVTFEEAQEILNQSGEIVQITVIHSLTDPSTNPSVRSRHPIIVRAETLGATDPPTSSRNLSERPKRRMLPKTPVEIKRDVRAINGCIWMQLDYDTQCQCLIVILLRAEDISTHHNGESCDPNAVVMLHLLPKRALHDRKETDVKHGTSNPQWNETFVFSNISVNELSTLSLEITVWNYQDVDDEFLGEVLLDLGEAQIDNTPTCYNLEDHDENSSPLPYRKKSFSYSECSAVSPVTSLDPSPRSSVSTKATGSQRTLPVTPAHDKMRGLMNTGKRSPVLQNLAQYRSKWIGIHESRSVPYLGRLQNNLNLPSREFTSSCQSSPLHSPTSPKEDSSFEKQNSFTSLLRRKVSAVARLSSSLIMGGRKEETFEDVGTFGRSKSYVDIRESNLLGVNAPTQARHSFESQRGRFEFLAPPYQRSRSNSSNDLLNPSSQELDIMNGPRPDRPAPEGDDITSVLGPGQIAPKPSYETNVCGDIKMGFMVSKGQLEIDIVVVKGLMKSGMTAPPDTYVKTYLVAGTKTVQKKKTQTIRTSFDPVFRKTVKYSACNIHGRCIKINVWEKQKTFDKKQCLGEAVVKLDNLDLSQHTMGWYKLFPLGATEFCSSESLTYWGFG